MDRKHRMGSSAYSVLKKDGVNRQDICLFKDLNRIVENVSFIQWNTPKTVDQGAECFFTVYCNWKVSIDWY